MPTDKQRREAARRHLERQLQRRQERQAARRRATFISSIGGSVIVIAAIVVIIVVVSSNNGSGGKSADAAASASATPTAAASASASATTTTSAAPTTSYPAATGASVSFDGVTVKGAKDLKGKPTVTSKSSTDPTKLEYKDLVVGKGTAAKAGASVTVQYDGVLYKSGTEFDSSWSRGAPATFTIDPTNVIPGFADGIGGTTGIPPMKVGGRRIIIMPAADGYGTASNGPVPANASLVFVVDLTKVG